MPMDTTRLPLWRRRTVKAALGLLILAFFAALVYVLAQREGQRVLREHEVRLPGRGNANADTLRRELDTCRRDAQFLASVPPVAGIARAQRNQGYDAREHTPQLLWEQRLASIFSAFLATHPAVFQARLIGLERNGMELVRVERTGGVIRTVPAEQLQAKGNTDYMREAARLAAGQVYLSDFNLNREHGKVELPPRPTLRSATPVMGPDGQPFAVLVINYDAAAMLAPLQTNLPPGVHAFLVNGSDDFLLHPAPQRAFGFDLERRWRWHDQFTPASAGLPGGLPRYAHPDGLLYDSSSVIVLDPQRPERNLTYHLGLDHALVSTAMATLAREVSAAILCGALLVTALALVYWRQYNRLHERQSRMSAIAENSHDAIIGKTLDGVVTSWNRGAEAMFGFTAGEAMGRMLADLIVPEALYPEDAFILRQVAGGTPVLDLVTRRRRKDGVLLDVSVTSSPIRDSLGRVIGAAKTVHDISAELAAQARIGTLNAGLEEQVRERTREIEEMASLQHAILAHASYALIATGPDGVVRLFNPAAEHMLGYAQDDVVGRQTPALWHDGAEVVARAAALTRELGQPVAAGFDTFVAKALLGQSDEHEWTFIRKDGARLPVSLSVSVLRQPDGAIHGYLGIATDISQRKIAERTLVAARDQLLNASQVAQLGIWTWTLASGELEWNSLMFDLYDVPPDQRQRPLSYEDWRSRVHPDDVDATVAKLQGAVAGTCVYDPVFRLLRPNGAVRHVQAAATVERDDQGNPLRVLGINRDVTTEHDVQETLQAARDAAEQANRTKSEFLANMSHEIRSPMNAVLGMLTLLKQTELNHRQYDYANKAETAGRALLGILNDILDFSRIEAGKLTLEPHPFSIDTMLRDIGVILAANVGDKPIDLRYDVAPGMPDWIVADSLRLQQVLLNLAGNAIKFTAQGEVVLSTQRLPALPADGPDTLRLGFAVHDTGIGISPEQCSRIFDGFSQAEASTARRFGGSGLGLSISQRLVHMMDGTLAVNSEVGRGSVFSFDIACRVAEVPPAAQRDAGRLHGLQCLVVDDHAAARASMLAMLTALGWRIDAVDSGEAALAALRQGGQGYDVIFVDWHMAGLDGWETCVRLRRLIPAARGTLLIMVTAHGNAVNELRQDGGTPVLDAFVVKPVTASLLFDAVADASAALSATDVRRRQDAPRSRLAGLRLLLVEDNLTNQQVARELLSSEGAVVDVAGDGRAAIAAVRDTQPPYDCVLMDVQMPEMDGYTATRYLRQVLELSTLPIIAMTANAMASDKQEALLAGMNDHVGKPFDLAQLVAVILHHSRGAAAAAAPANAAPPAQAGAARLDSMAALARFGGNTRVYGGALRQFSSEAPQLLGQVPADLPAPADRATVGRHLHSLKGIAGTIGAQQLAQAAQALEQVLGERGDMAAWPALRADLASKIGMALASVDALADELAPHAPAAGAAPARPHEVHEVRQVQDVLRQLHALLAESNLDAVATFEQLQNGFGAALGGKLARLQQALEQFDFAAAMQECDALQAALAERD